MRCSRICTAHRQASKKRLCVTRRLAPESAKEEYADIVDSYFHINTLQDGDETSRLCLRLPAFRYPSSPASLRCALSGAILIAPLYTIATKRLSSYQNGLTTLEDYTQDTNRNTSTWLPTSAVSMPSSVSKAAAHIQFNSYQSDRRHRSPLERCRQTPTPQHPPQAPLKYCR